MEEKFIEKKQDDGEDRGEIRTEFVRSHADIRAGGKTMCKEHTWKKMNDAEIYCVNCPTALLVGLNDERLLDKSLEIL